MNPLDPRSAHPSAEQLRAFNLGRLDDSAAVSLGEHLERCEACCQALRELPEHDVFVRRIRSAADTGPNGAAGGRAPARLGDYRIIREVGRGGMGIVYEAEQISLRRRVAVKVLPAGKLPDAAALGRFRREARLAARLHHTNIVPVHEVGQDGDTCFYAMQLIAGRSLDRVLAGLRAGRPRSGPPPTASLSGISTGPSRPSFGDTLAESAPAPAEPATALPRPGPHDVAALGIQVAEALAYAHARGVLHRDIKPSNLLLDDAGTVWVTDFGLAKVEDDDLTGTGAVVGTLRYMAPERFRGHCDVRADVYALGCTLYELATLRPAFDSASSAELMRQVLERDPPRVRELNPDVSRDLETIIHKAMDRDPARRYPTAQELVDDLRRFLAGLPTRARPPGPVERLVRWTRRYPAVAALTAAVAMALVLGTSVSLYFARASGLAETRAVASETAARRQSASLLLDRALELARAGEVPEALHRLYASLEQSPDPEFRRRVRTHLATWGGRVAVLRRWIDSPHPEAALSPDGRVVAAVGPTGTDPTARKGSVQFWEVDSGAARSGVLGVEEEGVTQSQFSPDGTTLLAASGGHQVRQGNPGWATLWDAVGGKGIGRSVPAGNTVSRAVWLSDGKRFVLLGDDHWLRVRNADGSVCYDVPLGERALYAAVTPDGGALLVALGNGTLELRDLASGARLESQLPTLSPPALWVGFSPDGMKLYTATGKDAEPRYLETRLWDWAARKPTGDGQRRPFATNTPTILTDGRLVADAPARITSDGRRFLTTGNGVQVWDSPRTTSCAPSDPRPLAGQPLYYSWFSPDGRLAWSGGWFSQAWDVEAARPIRHPAPRGGGGLAVSPDGRRVGMLMGVGTDPFTPGQVWDSVAGEVCSPLLEHHNAGIGMVFHPRGDILLSGGHFHSTDLWDFTRGRHAAPPQSQGGMILSMAFSPDGRRLAVGTHEREARLLDGATGKPICEPLRHTQPVHRVAFSPDGRRLLTLTSDGGQLWGADTGRPHGRPLPFKRAKVQGSGALRGLFSPGGSVVLVCSGNSHFSLFDAATCEPLGEPSPEALDRETLCFGFSPDGKLLVVGCTDGTAGVWDVRTVRPVGAPVVQAGRVRGVAFKPDGNSFVTLTEDGTLRTWPVPGPLEGSPERIGRMLRLTTGSRLDARGTSVPLTRAEWAEEIRLWREAEGDADWALVPPASDDVWEEARARDAEQAGAWYTARYYLDRLIDRSPNDWMLYARRARSHTQEGNLDRADADYRNASGCGEGEALLEWYRHRAAVCRTARNIPAARFYLDRILSLRPDEWRPRAERAATLTGPEEAAERDAAFAEALRRGADATTLIVLGRERVEQGRWDEAAELLGRAARLSLLPGPSAHWCAVAVLRKGDRDCYRHLCRQQMESLADGSQTPPVVNRVAWLLALAPDGVDDYAQPIRLLEAALARMPEGTRQRSAYLNTLGAILVRAGRYREAIDRLTEAGKVSPNGASPHDCVFLTMAHHRLGETAKAREWFDRAGGAKVGQPMRPDEAELDLLGREAKALIDAAN